MNWSISTYKEFQRCQRKWFFNHKVASRSLKNAYRREVFFLSELESIDAWRGKIVDYTISELVVNKLNKKQTIDAAEVYDFAKKVARARYDFAQASRFKEPEMKKTAHEYEYSAIYDFEYANDSAIIKDRFKKAWSEIEIAITNFLQNSELISDLRNAEYLIKQRNLKFPLHGFTVQAVPDLIAFYSDKPPHIVDWKVHYFGTKSYNEQLLIYAVALKTCSAHRDFPDSLNKYSIQDIDLTEYQLLRNSVRNYKITEDHIEVINDFIASGLQLMRRKHCDDKYENLNIDDFEKTPNLENCTTCPFKKLCKEE